MITRIRTGGTAGSGETKEIARDEIHNLVSVSFLELDLSDGFNPIEIKPGYIILERYNEECTQVEYQRYEGSPKDMGNLVTLAKAHKVADTATA